ncbi:MAG: prephenate dehydratase [Flavobacteriales bacterium]|jgi:prephenate dehydratase|uniref:prephenate dehydratase n=1 Tax=Blattabacterium sp. (Mastotermes darwiniensis) TaxID=39768 RepID=UPI000231DF74|nr:prephenate dehydratase domain-containing protein [Blattabacterium sp. (Mastotermes darwiniensis)]AER40396.1 prephenate dehydratase [Blattabacterium sp. (Mastotermes darwiniensis) str. MADAR]MDR1804883.1 prephenate dehydratase [Flavobacteriales bacterium]
MKKIAIQGGKGCFHHAAVSRYFEGCNYKLMECSSFREIAYSVAKSNVDIGFMAIENTIAGSILTNYSLLSEYNLRIVGEVFMPIQHHLMAFPGQKLEDIKEIYSHPMAILQCESFIESHPDIRTYKYSNTAYAAKYILNINKKGLAAIASEKAANEYGLEIIARNIQTLKSNFTRFFVIKNFSKKYKKENDFDKASLSLKITTGSISKVLSLIYSLLFHLGIKMTKIQYIIENPWKYSFYVDILFNSIINYERMKERIQKIPCIHKLSIMGEYKNGRILS